MAAVIELPASHRAQSAAMSGNALALHGVTRQFGALRAIDDITFDVPAGERRAILGANGAGKTTLFNAITGDFPPTQGTFISSVRTSRCCHRTSGFGAGCDAPTNLHCCFASCRCETTFSLRYAVAHVAASTCVARTAPTRASWLPKHCCIKCVSIRSAIRRSLRCRTGNNGSSRSGWHWPARRD